MSKKLSYTFVLFGLLGFISLIPGLFDKVAYIYFRTVDGSSIAVEGKCFKVPAGWVIDSIGSHSGHSLFNLRKKGEKGYMFASVIVGLPSIIPDHERLSPVKGAPDLYSIYELEGLVPTNTVRYWSVLPDQSLLLMGRKIDVLVELSMLTWSKECE
ncbi:MAG: hypothetical protein KUG72_09060 [Pseudomonadales bacterium]|nr:hypothetical protein [Pseudomonadales bacterium]